MKKLILIVISLFIISTGFSQIKGLTLGPKIGVNFSKISSNVDEMKENMKPGFEVGAFVRIGQKLYIQPEVMYKFKGGKFDIDGISTSGQTINYNYKVKLQTVDVPLMVGVRIINLKVMNIRLMLGPVASFVLNKDIDSDDSNPVPDMDDNDFKDLNWGFQGGAGVDILFLTLDLRYEQGLSNIYDGKTTTGKTIDFKNNLWTVTLGFKIL